MPVSTAMSEWRKTAFEEHQKALVSQLLLLHS